MKNLHSSSTMNATTRLLTLPVGELGFSSCLAHTLELAIHNGFNLIVPLIIVSAGRLLGCFNYCSPACKTLIGCRLTKVNYRSGKIESNFARGIVMPCFALVSALKFILYIQ